MVILKSVSVESSEETNSAIQDAMFQSRPAMAVNAPIKAAKCKK